MRAPVSILGRGPRLVPIASEASASIGIGRIRECWPALCAGAPGEIDLLECCEVTVVSALDVDRTQVQDRGIRAPDRVGERCLVAP